MTLGESARKAREEKFLSQQQLSELSGVPVNSIQRLENDKNIPLLTTVIALSRALGITIDKYIGTERKT